MLVGGKGEVIGTNITSAELYLMSSSVVEFMVIFSPTINVGMGVGNP
jgi:hypothetical protein